MSIPVIPVSAPLSSTRVAEAIKTKPRYRARVVRLVLVDLARRREGVTLDEARDDFWIRYGYEPTRILMSQQVAMLVRDKLVQRVDWGAYKAFDGATVTAITPSPVHAPAAHAPAAPSIFD